MFNTKHENLIIYTFKITILAPVDPLDTLNEGVVLSIEDLKHHGEDLDDKEDNIIPIASSIEATRDEEALDEPTGEHFNGENTDTKSENH